MTYEAKPLNEFQAWPKIPRYKPVMMHITEKIDGTNACVVVAPIGPYTEEEVDKLKGAMLWNDGLLVVLAASRTRFITPEDDNFGFARWVKENAEELVKLGIGRHYGEWYGAVAGTRRYGLDHKRFALFHERNPPTTPSCCSVVPTLYFGPLDNSIVQQVHADLLSRGSQAVPGWMQPEGIVVKLVGDARVQKITDAEQGKKHAVPAAAPANDNATAEEKSA